MADPIEKEKEQIQPTETPVTETPAAEAPANEEVSTEESTGAEEEVVEEPKKEEDPSDVLTLSDEDFEKTVSASGAPATTEEEDVNKETSDVDKAAEEAATAAEAEKSKETEDAAKAAEAEANKKEEEIPGLEEVVVKTEDAVAGYKILMAPFKANGKTVQAKSPQEALRLMQMGAGHVKYQQQIKPLLVRAKTLENNKIDDNQLNFLIELNNKNPEAIKKLVRDAGIDPYDIDTGDESKAADKDYRPKNYSADESQITLEETLTDVQASEHGSELLKSVRADWDDESRKTILNDPAILTVLADQKQNGVYDQIAAEIDRQKILGGLSKVSFLTAYYQVGTEMEKSGAFRKEPASTEPGQTPSTAPASTPTKSEVLAKKADTPKKPDSSDAVKSIAEVKKVVTPQPDHSNIMDMPDDEFEKTAGLEQFA